MLDSNAPFPDPDSPCQVAEWLESLPASTLPPTRRTVNYLYRDGDRSLNVKVTRPAQVAIAGSDELSTLKVVEQCGGEIDRQIAAMLARGAEPITGWVLDEADLI